MHHDDRQRLASPRPFGDRSALQASSGQPAVLADPVPTKDWGRRVYGWSVAAGSVMVAGTIALVPFHAFLTVWLAHLTGHYTAWRLWKEIILAGLVVASGVWLALCPALRCALRQWRAAQLIGAFCAVQLTWGVVALVAHRVTLLALAYGWLVDMRFLVFFLVGWLIAQQDGRLARWWPKLVLLPAAVVTLFGLLQYFVLPYNFLVRFGYGLATIFPYEDINHNLHYLRVMSTLRGANPLGVYLVTVLALTAALLIVRWPHIRRWYQRLPLVLLFIADVAVLGLTFSRGAWIGAIAAAVTMVAGQAYQRPLHMPAALGRWWLPGAVVLVVATAGLVVAARHNVVLQNVLWHTQTDSSVPTTSNAGHVSALTQALGDIQHQPLGLGPGTAGPASAYNAGHPVRIAENYFLQIAQETGWPGLILFVGLLAAVGRELWCRRGEPLALGLLAGLAGVCVASFFSHTWADDTLAYLWWGLAGTVCAWRLAPHTDQS